MKIIKMNKKSKRRLLIGIPIFIWIAFLFYWIAFLFYWITEPYFFLNRKLTPDTRIIQVPFTNKDYLTTTNGSPILGGIRSWVIDNDYIYGEYYTDRWKHFLYNSTTKELLLYDNKDEWWKQINELTLPEYTETNSETSYHLQRNIRLYPIAFQEDPKSSCEIQVEFMKRVAFDGCVTYKKSYKENGKDWFVLSIDCEPIAERPPYFPIPCKYYDFFLSSRLHLPVPEEIYNCTDVSERVYKEADSCSIFVGNMPFWITDDY